MKSLLLFTLFSSLILVCYSAVFLERQLIVSGHEKLCYDKADNVFYKKGEEMKWKFKGCGRKICKGSYGKEYTYAEVQTCGNMYSPPGCQIEVDINLAYPHCCGRIICSERHDSNVNTTQNFPYSRFK